MGSSGLLAPASLFAGSARLEGLPGALFTYSVYGSYLVVAATKLWVNRVSGGYL